MEKNSNVLIEKRPALKVIEIIAALAAPVLVLVITYFLCGIMYDTNDDRYIAGLISGEITGSGSVVEYCGCIITWPLSLLYRLTPGAPLWGLFLLLVFVVSDYILIFSLSKIVKNFPLAVISCVVLNMSMLYMQAEINFTGIAIIASVAGYAALINDLLYEEGKKQIRGMIVFLLMELLAACIRRDSMLVVQPFGMILLGSLALSEGMPADKKTIKECALKWIKTMAKAVVLFAISIALFFTGNFLGGKNSEEYTRYRRFNDVGTAYFDYCNGVIGYDDLKPVLEGTDITESKWNAMSEYTAFDWNEDTETYKRIESFLYERLEHPGIAGIIGGIFKNTFLLHSFWLTLFLWGVAFVLSLAKGKRKYLIPVILMMVPHLSVWGYIVYMGRIQNRVVYPLFLCEEIAFTLIIFAIIRSYGGIAEFLQNGIRKYAFVPVAAVVVVGCILISQGQYEECKKANTAKESLVMGMIETADYCRRHPEEQYILDQNAFSNYFGGPLTAGFYKPSNYTIGGSWYSMTPAHAERMTEIISDTDGFNYIVVDYGDGEEGGRIKGYSAVYLKEVTGREPVLVDTYEVSSGNRFLVYRFADTTEGEGENL